VANAEFNGIAGFHLSEIYSPWSSPVAMAVAFMEAKHGGVEMLQTWVNTSLGETWEEKGESANETQLMERREEFAAEVPEGALILTAGVDIQSDRIELEVAGWSETQESWSVDYLILPGDPAQPEVWEALKDALLGDYKTAEGQSLRISSVCIDSGFMARGVYDFVTSFRARYVYPIKGMAGPGRPIVESITARARRLRRRKSNTVRPEMIGVDEAKTLLMRRLKLLQPGPGYCHFSIDRDEEYFSQITAEQRVVRYKKGRAYYEWVKTRPRNEALDCRVYAHAALLLADPDWNRLKSPITVQQPTRKPEPKRENQHRRPLRQRYRR
jgi:phage terminase large subunit GpA-like protein